MNNPEPVGVWSAINALRTEVEALGADYGALEDLINRRLGAETVSRQRAEDGADLRMARIETALWELEKRTGA